MKEIYVDIDGTLTNETIGHDYANRTPHKKNIKIVNKLYNAGHLIILWTARYGIDNDVTRNWLRDYGVKYSTIIYDKPNYDILIDDRAVSDFNNEVINNILADS